MSILVVEAKSFPTLEHCDLWAYMDPPKVDINGDHICFVEIRGAIALETTIRTNNAPDCLFSALVFLESALDGGDGKRAVFFPDGSPFVPRLVLFGGFLKARIDTNSLRPA